AKGKGILLLHDIQARTVAMLPTLLRELKARGYHIVHVVPATPDRPKTPTEPSEWLMHPENASASASAWPPVPRFAYASTIVLAAPDVINARRIAATGPTELSTLPHSRTGGFVPLAPAGFWPRPVVTASPVADRLPAPDKALFDVPTAEIRFPTSHHLHAQ